MGRGGKKQTREKVGYLSSCVVKYLCNQKGDSCYSRIVDDINHAGYYDLAGGRDELGYRVSFVIEEAVRGKVTLLSTPVFGNVTIFYSERVEAVSYELISNCVVQ